jgi:hypothetical protein
VLFFENQIDTGRLVNLLWKEYRLDWSLLSSLTLKYRGSSSDEHPVDLVIPNSLNLKNYSSLDSVLSVSEESSWLTFTHQDPGTFTETQGPFRFKGDSLRFDLI